MRAQYEFLEGLGLGLQIEGDAATVNYFNREYGPAATREPASIAIEVIVDGAGRLGWPIESSGGHKSMHWRTSLSAPEAAVLGLRVELSGWPRGFARTLVQGFFIEPLISVAAAHADAVLLPAAAFRYETGALVILGRSGSGKTSLSMHALALGVSLFGDDQVLIDPSGSCRAFPRRMRLYSDLGRRAPMAFRRLPRHVVAQLRARGLLRTVSRGVIAPSLAVPVSVFGERNPVSPALVRRVVILERPDCPGEVRIEPSTAADAVNEALRLLRDQRRQLAVAGGDVWRRALTAVENDEERLLGAAFANASVERITAPSPLSGDSMARLAAAVGIGAVTGR
jgi:hypothetical protein